MIDCPCGGLEVDEEVPQLPLVGQGDSAEHTLPGTCEDNLLRVSE